MCNFFSLISDGKGKIYYFDSKIRKQIREGKLNYEEDSHTSIADYFGFKGEKEDKLNRYEYNPLTKEFKIDQINTNFDGNLVRQQCYKLDFSKIVPKLIIKSIINPFEDKHRKRVTKKDIEKLKEWKNFCGSFRSIPSRNFILDFIEEFPAHAFFVFLKRTIRIAVASIIWKTLRISMKNIIEKKLFAKDFLWISFEHAVAAYITSFYQMSYWKYFKIKKGVNPFQPCADLWESGLVPSYDGETWRLHGEKGKVIFKLEEGAE